MLRRPARCWWMAINLDSAPKVGTRSIPRTTLVGGNAQWRYLANGTNQGTAWKEPGFGDGSWGLGAAELGYGDGGEATTIGYGPDENNKYITTYFRHTFVVSDPLSLG